MKQYVYLGALLTVPICADVMANKRENERPIVTA
jgi:hypothetical protein